MSLKDYVIEARDKFEPDDDNFGFSFPCNAYRHRHKSDSEEPCRSCDHNLGAVPEVPRA